MPRTCDPKVAERNQRLIADFLENKFQDYRVLGAKYGMEFQLVYRVLKDAGLTRKDRRKPRVKQSDRKPLSHVHAILGNKIRHGLLSTTLEDRGDADFQVGGYAYDLMMSPQRLGKIFLGVEDPTLTELLRISEKINKPLVILLGETIKEVSQYSLKKLGTFG